jgi:hypothetical protein
MNFQYPTRNVKVPNEENNTRTCLAALTTNELHLFVVKPARAVLLFGVWIFLF